MLCNCWNEWFNLLRISGFMLGDSEQEQRFPSLAKIISHRCCYYNRLVQYWKCQLKNTLLPLYWDNPIFTHISPHLAVVRGSEPSRPKFPRQTKPGASRSSIETQDCRKLSLIKHWKIHSPFLQVQIQKWNKAVNRFVKNRAQ